jgi:hypothetical protein
MSGTGPEIPTGLDEFQVFRLFKCAVKDDSVPFRALGSARLLADSRRPKRRAHDIAEERSTIGLKRCVDRLQRRVGPSKADGVCR